MGKQWGGFVQGGGVTNKDNSILNTSVLGEDDLIDMVSRNHHARLTKQRMHV